MSGLETHAGFFKLLMKGILDPYVLLPFDKKLIFELVICVRTRKYMVSVVVTSKCLSEALILAEHGENMLCT